MPTTIPVLPATDIEGAAEFYRQLGFVEDDRAPDYLIVVHPVGD
jgi:predicted lactoylglutathione lyase